MTQIKQDTEKVHLLGEDGAALCRTEDVERGVNASDWLRGFTPATVGSRVCRACEEKAGTAAVFEEGEKPEDGTTWKALDE